MGRPKKQTVDYFPHMCNHKKTMFILEQKYGNDGYSFWFKLLEMLGSYEGHFINLKDAADWEFLQSKTRLNEDNCCEILDLLAKLEAIDQELWEQKIVWSQNFVDGLSPVYANRRQVLPKKPSFYRQKPDCVDVSTEEKRQSRVEESRVERVEESRGKEQSGGGVTFKDITRIFSNNIHPITPTEAENLQHWLNDGMEPDVVIYAIQQAVKASAFNINYIDAILINLHTEGVTTKAGVEARERKRLEAKRQKKPPEEPTLPDIEYEYIDDEASNTIIKRPKVRGMPCQN